MNSGVFGAQWRQHGGRVVAVEHLPRPVGEQMQQHAGAQATGEGNTPGRGRTPGLQSLAQADLSATMHQEYELARRMLASEDAIEGPRAFAQKRKPVWRGR